MKNLIGGYWVLVNLPIWATAIILYMITLGAIFVLRDKFEGLFYNTSYSAMLGDGALLVVVLMAAEILKRGVLLPEWAQGTKFHWVAVCLGVVLGIVWYTMDDPVQWADSYHHLVIAPLLCYLGITLLPVIFRNGTRVEVISTLVLVALWATLVVYDSKTGRLDQRNYRSLGRCLDIIKSGR
jgi:hypothetical protein